jgi:hypothetical protein
MSPAGVAGLNLWHGVWVSLFKIDLPKNQKGPAGVGKGPAPYLRADETEVNMVLTLAPRPFTTATIATAIPAARRLYSIAVAADSSLRKALRFRAMLGI